MAHLWVLQGPTSNADHIGDNEGESCPGVHVCCQVTTLVRWMDAFESYLLGSKLTVHIPVAAALALVPRHMSEFAADLRDGGQRLVSKDSLRQASRHWSTRLSNVWEFDRQCFPRRHYQSQAHEDISWRPELLNLQRFDGTNV